MASVAVTIKGLIYPKNKTVPPYPATIVGYAEITGLTVGGGPVLPPETVPPVEPPLVIWPNPPEGSVLPEHPIVLPDPPTPPIDPPAAVEPPHEGWNWSAAKSGWYYLYVPGKDAAGPKSRR